MSEQPAKRRIVVPKGPLEPRDDRSEHEFEFSFGESDERDTSKPIGYDEHGRPLYAPRGVRFQIPWR